MKSFKRYLKEDNEDFGWDDLALLVYKTHLQYNWDKGFHIPTPTQAIDSLDGSPIKIQTILNLIDLLMTIPKEVDPPVHAPIESEAETWVGSDGIVRPLPGKKVAEARNSP